LPHGKEKAPQTIHARPGPKSEGPGLGALRSPSESIPCTGPCMRRLAPCCRTEALHTQTRRRPSQLPPAESSPLPMRPTGLPRIKGPGAKDAACLIENTPGPSPVCLSWRGFPQGFSRRPATAGHGSNVYQTCKTGSDGGWKCHAPRAWFGGGNRRPCCVRSHRNRPTPPLPCPWFERIVRIPPIEKRPQRGPRPDFADVPSGTDTRVILCRGNSVNAPTNSGGQLRDFHRCAR